MVWMWRGGLTCDAITHRLASEVTVTGDMAVTGAFLTDIMRSSEAARITVDDKVTVTGNLVIGTTNVLTSLSQKAPLASPSFTGVVTVQTRRSQATC